MVDTENIKKLVGLLSNGYKVKEITSFMIADPNQASPLNVKLKKGNDEITLVFRDSEIDIARQIIEKN